MSDNHNDIQRVLASIKSVMSKEEEKKGNSERNTSLENETCDIASETHSEDKKINKIDKLFEKMIGDKISKNFDELIENKLQYIVQKVPIDDITNQLVSEKISQIDIDDLVEQKINGSIEIDTIKQSLTKGVENFIIDKQLDKLIVDIINRAIKSRIDSFDLEITFNAVLERKVATLLAEWELSK